MIIKVGKEDVNLDEKNLDISYETINDFLPKYASWYRYYNSKFNDASFIAKKYTDQYNQMLNLKFKHYKQEFQYSDKMSEACAKADEEVLAAQEKMRAAEYVKDELLGYLKSLDYAHEDTLQMCYNIRKEMDKITTKSVKMEQKLEDIFKKGD